METSPPKNFQPATYTGGTLYHFSPDLVAYEHSAPPLSPTPNPTSGPGSDADSSALNTIVFLTGIGGSLLSTAYPVTLALALPPTWRLVQPTLSSSHTGFGTASLDTDVAETALLVAYLRTLRPKGKIVLLGHSTGCQDSLHYVVAPGGSGATSPRPGEAQRPRVDGIVLQAPASDRQALEIAASKDQVDRGDEMARGWVADGRGEDVLPRSVSGVFGPAPVSARRWLSFTSPGPEHAGVDDYFSSDLGAERWRTTFGSVGKGVRVLALHMGDDEYVPKEVDKGGWVGEWREAVEGGGGEWDEESGVLEGGDHALEKCGKEVLDNFVGMVVRFLGRV